MNPLISPARFVPGTRSAGILESGLIALVSGQSYINVVFPSPLLGTSWSVLASVLNTIDSNPLNIWPGILTAKSTLGFTLQLNGMPDSSNYYLYWVIAPGGVLPDATTYTLSGPSTGGIGAASAPFTVALPVGAPVTGTVTVTPHDGGGGGTFIPATVNLTTIAPSATFTYTPASMGAKTISVTNSGGLTDPGSLTYTVTLKNGLISYWKLDEASGTRNDSQGTNHLTQVNTPASVTGKIGNAAKFVSASSQYLDIASNSSLVMSGNTDFTITAWVRIDATGASILIGKDSAVSRDYTIDYSAGFGLRFYIQGGSTYLVQTTGTGTVGTWYFMVCWYDSSNGQLHVRVNDTTTWDSPSTGATGTDTGASHFRIGAREYSGAEGYANATIDEVGIWKRKLTAAEMTLLYNGGAGLPYSSF